MLPSAKSKRGKYCYLQACLLATKEKNLMAGLGRVSMDKGPLPTSEIDLFL
jgi:hypothetical protein